jgi:hypothetical protein
MSKLLATAAAVLTIALCALRSRPQRMHECFALTGIPARSCIGVIVVRFARSVRTTGRVAIAAEYEVVAAYPRPEARTVGCCPPAPLMGTRHFSNRIKMRTAIIAALLLASCETPLRSAQACGA